MTLSKYINEQLHISSNTKTARIKTTLVPKDKNELKSIIKDEIKQQGPDADLTTLIRLILQICLCYLL